MTGLKCESIQVDTREVGQLNDLIEAFYNIHSHEFVKQNPCPKDMAEVDLPTPLSYY